MYINSACFWLFSSAILL